MAVGQLGFIVSDFPSSWSTTFLAWALSGARACGSGFTTWLVNILWNIHLNNTGCQSAVLLLGSINVTRIVSYGLR